MEFNNDTIKALRLKLKTALLAGGFEEDDIKVGRINYSPDEATITLTAYAQGAEESAKKTWDLYCRNYDLKPTDFGREFNSGAQRYRIVGLKTSRPKYPISVVRISDKSPYKMPRGTVVSGLERESYVPEPTVTAPDGHRTKEDDIEAFGDLSAGAMF